MILRRKKVLILSQPESVSAAVSRLEGLTDRLEETTEALKEMLAHAREEVQEHES